MRAYLQLLRLPNVFTAMADILLGFLFTHETLAPVAQFLLLLAASCSLYLAGMVLNDYFDQEQDARERPFRPLPSGRISPPVAGSLGAGLLLAGVTLGWSAAAIVGDARPGVTASLLAVCVFLYDGVLKKSSAGPLVMGACRTLNVLLGMSAAMGAWHAAHYIVAAAIGIYIVGVTIFARSEAIQSARPQLITGLAVFLAGIAMLGLLPHWVTGQEWPDIYVNRWWNLQWLAIGLWVAWPAARAIIKPAPQTVQSAVKTCIFSLILIDAGAVLAVQGVIWAAVILVLLLPAVTLGRWIYAT